MTLLAILGLYAAAYLARARTLKGYGRPVSRWRAASFLAGLVVLGAAVSAPVAALASDRLAAHMAEHLLIGDVASLLLVLGLTGPMLAPLLRIPWIGRLRALAHPIPALTLWAANLWLWHLPVAYEGALHHDLVHVVEHGCFLLFGMNLWMPLFGPFPKPEWFGSAAQFGYILAVRLTGAALANLFVWSGAIFYSSYRAPGDQSAAGAIMMAEESVLLVGLTAWWLARWISDAGQRQELAELAETRGVTLGEQRIARAVAAGRADDLRRRLLG